MRLPTDPVTVPGRSGRLDFVPDRALSAGNSEALFARAPIPVPTDMEGTGRFLRLATRSGAKPQAGRAYGRVIEATVTPASSIGDDAFVDRVQPALALLDDDAGLHAGAADRAKALVAAIACCVPVLIDDADGLAGHLPAELLDSMRANPASVTNSYQRDLLASQQRRIAWDLLSPRHLDAGFGRRRRSISVTVVSNRPSQVEHWAGLLARQDHPDFEVVAVMHGEPFPAAAQDHLRERFGDRLTLLSTSTDHNLGDALNVAAEAAAGDLIVKWDDDDYYSTRHLRDLAAIYETSRAHIVGKAAEFVYLAGVDVTVRRGSLSREAFSPSLAGPTLTIGRHDLFEVGGWPSVPRQVDTRVIERVKEAGGSSFRASGFGFLLMRNADPGTHTWNADADYFLERATEQRRGLALEFADIDV